MISQPKKKKVKKLSVVKVQDAVNKAIRARDETCIVRDGRHECAGVLTASHYHCVGGNSTFRFYPPNIHAQCFGHHGIHERGQEPFFYRRWMQEYEPDALEFMETHWNASIKYSQPVLRDIYTLALSGNLDGLKEYVEKQITG
jgi:hypothetical protein